MSVTEITPLIIVIELSNNQSNMLNIFKKHMHRPNVLFLNGFEMSQMFSTVYQVFILL